jgi:hypothetical protein
MKIIAFIILASAVAGLHAQTESPMRAPFQFSFIYPLSTNGLNASLYENAVSLNALAGVSRNETAFALGGLANIALNNASGLQIAGLYNHAGNSGKGIAIAGLANFARQSFSGLQLAGLANFAGDVNGMQFSPIINIARKVRGVQFAALINIADEADFPIGLINLIKNGEKTIAATVDETGSAILSFRSGGKYTYGILGYGYAAKAGKQTFVTQGGLGAHIYLTPKFALNNEITIDNLIESRSNSFKTGYSLLPAYKLSHRFGCFAGAGIYYMYSDNPEKHAIFPSNTLWEKHSANDRRQVYIGYKIGVQYVF